MNASKIYVACLSSYNAGILHGAWVDADQTAEEMSADVQAMLAESGFNVAEEYAIHDSEGFGDALGEWSSLDEVAEIVELFADFSHCGEEAVLLALKHVDPYDGVKRVTLARAMLQGYQGEHDSRVKWAYDAAESVVTGLCEIGQRYFDYDSWAHDMWCGGDMIEVRGNGCFHYFSGFYSVDDLEPCHR